MQSLFTKFFERKTSKEPRSPLSTKRKKKDSNRTLDQLSPVILDRLVARNSNSPSPKREENKFSKAFSPTNNLKYSPRNLQKIPNEPVTKNFLQPIHQNNHKTKNSPSPTNNASKNNFQKIYKIFHQTGSSRLASSKERSSEPHTGHSRSPKKPITITHQSNLKIIRKHTTKETLEKKLNSTIGSESPERSLKKKIDRVDIGKLMEDKKKANREFLQNAKNNKPELCLQMLSSSPGTVSADINCKDKDGWTAMHHAAYLGNRKFAEILLFNDAKVNEMDASGVTPLILAVAGGHTNVVQILLNANSMVDHKDHNGNTALHYAASLKHVLCIELIIEKKPDAVFVQNAEGLTPLDKCNEELKKLILRRFARISADSITKEHSSPRRDRALQSTKLENSGKAISQESECSSVSFDSPGTRSEGLQNHRGFGGRQLWVGLSRRQTLQQQKVCDKGPQQTKPAS